MSREVIARMLTILDVLCREGRWMTTKELVEKLNIEYNKLYYALTRLVGLGVVECKKEMRVCYYRAVECEKERVLKKIEKT